MKQFAAVLLFIAMTFLCWGAYGPILHDGQILMGKSSLRPFVCVGVAYFLIAVLIPLIWIRTRGEVGHWTFSGTVWSLIAGAFGALGSLGIILAFKFRGNPIYVMPLVFGMAPVMNTVVTMWMTKTFRQAGVIFLGGIVLVATGAAGVMYFKPTAGGANKPKIDVKGELITITQMPHGPDGKEKITWGPVTLAELRDSEDLVDAYKIYQKQQPLTFSEFAIVLMGVALTAISWGSYGPVLHKGQVKMAGSRLRPFMCVGFAYFIIAVVVPLIILGAWNEPGNWGWDTSGWLVAFIAGVITTVGALGIIMAFNFGGKPIYVMPLVFGFAPVVNTFIALSRQKTFDQISTPFVVALLMVIVGAVTVLIFAPKPPKKTVTSAAKTSSEPAPV